MLLIRNRCSLTSVITNVCNYVKLIYKHCKDFLVFIGIYHQENCIVNVFSTFYLDSTLFG